MWPFRKKKSKAEIALEWMPKATDFAAFKWLELEAQSWAQAMSLIDKIVLFRQGVMQGFRRWPAYRDAPEEVIFLIMFRGIEKSGSYSNSEINAAFQAVGVNLNLPAIT